MRIIAPVADIDESSVVLAQDGEDASGSSSDGNQSASSDDEDQPFHQSDSLNEENSDRDSNDWVDELEDRNKYSITKAHLEDEAFEVPGRVGGVSAKRAETTGRSWRCFEALWSWGCTKSSEAV